MKALILAAGRGHRLWPFTAERPKCMLTIGQGISILEHQIANLSMAGVDRVALVCGYGLEQIRSAVEACGTAPHVKLVYNPFYAVADNLISLWSARSEMDGDFILLNGDNILHHDILPSLLASEGDCTIATNRKDAYDADDMKVEMRAGMAVRIGKGLPAAETHAESVGLVKFTGEGVGRIRRTLEEVVVQSSALRSLFTDALQRMMDDGFEVSTVDIDGLPWVDVDTPEDLKSVRQRQHLFCPLRANSARHAAGRA